MAKDVDAVIFSKREIKENVSFHERKNQRLRFDPNQKQYTFTYFATSKRLYDIIHVFSNVYNTTIAQTLRNFLWAGVYHKDQERKEKGLCSLIELTSEYHLKKEQHNKDFNKKQLQDQIKKENEDIINNFWLDVKPTKKP